MDFYDIFNSLTKGIRFKDRVIGVQPKRKTKSVKVVVEEKLSGTIDSDTEDLITDDLLDIHYGGDEVKDVGIEKQNKFEIMEGLTIADDEMGTVRKRAKKIKLVTIEKQKQIEQEEHNRFRNEQGIRVAGRRVPPALTDFTDLSSAYGVSTVLMDNLKKCGYHTPTPIQRQALTCMLQNRDILASAPTGSGKTVAFLLPVLNTLQGPRGAQGAPRAVILCPTRELAQQTHTEALRLSESTGLVCTQLSKSVVKRMNEKKSELRVTDLLISTPSRLCYLFQMENSPIKFNKIEWLVVDEADRLVEGSAEHAADFHSQLNAALSACTLDTSDGNRRHMALLSATHTPVLARLARRHTHKLITITIGHRNTAATTVEQKLTYCGNESGKLLEFRQLIKKGIQPPVLVFVQSKERAKQLFKELLYDGINVDVIHADRTQQQRDNVVRSFRCGGVWVLVCTELMARGLDFRGVNLVINYDLPPSAISYIHRVGRAGRAGRTGEAVTFFTDEDVPNLRSIAVVMKESGCEVPEFLLGLKKASSDQKKKLVFKPPSRDDITTAINRKRRNTSYNSKEQKKFKSDAQFKKDSKQSNLNKKQKETPQTNGNESKKQPGKAFKKNKLNITLERNKKKSKK